MDGVAKGKFNVNDFLSSIDDHLPKADFTAIDMRKMAAADIETVDKHISTLNDANKAKIITIK